MTEVDLFTDAALRFELHNARSKCNLLKFAARTSLRLSECLNILKRDLVVCKDYVKVKALQKGKKEFETAISIDFYRELLESGLKNLSDNDKVFGELKARTIETMIQRLKKHIGFSEDRNIVFHSFRGVAINYEYDVSGDIKKAMLQGNHSNSVTTFKYYLDKQRDLSNAPGVKMDKEENREFLKELSKEDYMNFFENVKIDTLNELKRYLKNR
ncbi:site-specific integrase [Terribacillus aidingensis]|uniref:site-specific integrase n=1 Tax=Terribacillus aidingensis TaxID=586416 RepID=UPI002481C000|nr:site-specific integrase [Terribacillus aidingensis]